MKKKDLKYLTKLAEMVSVGAITQEEMLLKKEEYFKKKKKRKRAFLISFISIIATIILTLASIFVVYPLANVAQAKSAIAKADYDKAIECIYNAHNPWDVFFVLAYENTLKDVLVDYFDSCIESESYESVFKALDYLESPYENDIYKHYVYGYKKTLLSASNEITVPENCYESYYNAVLARYPYPTSDDENISREVLKALWRQSVLFRTMPEDFKDCYNICKVADIIYWNSYESYSDDFFEKIQPYMNFAPAKQYVTNSSRLNEYLLGYWSTKDNKYYIKFYEKENSVWMSYDLPVKKNIDHDYYDVYDGVISWEKEGKKVYDICKINIISETKIEIYCFENGKTYVLQKK